MEQIHQRCFLVSCQPVDRVLLFLMNYYTRILTYLPVLVQQDRLQTGLLPVLFLIVDQPNLLVEYQS